MSCDENLLKDIWFSLYRTDICSKVKGVHSQIIGPFMLLERTVVAFKELGQSYVSNLQDVYQIKSDLDSATKELKILREKLNETQKPCENCEALSKELTSTKKRASEAEFRVTQIAKILVVNSSKDVDPSEDVRSPSKSPKRKKACIRDKCDNGNSSFDSQTVEVGFTNSDNEVIKDNDDSFQNESLTLRSPKIKNVNSKVKRLSKSADCNDELSTKITPRRNLSFEFETEHSSASKRGKKIITGSKKNNDDAQKVLTTVKKGNELLDEYSKKYGSEHDKLWFANDGTGVDIKNKNKHNNVESTAHPSNEESFTTISPRIRNKKPDINTETEKYRRNTQKSNRTLRSDKTVKNSDNTYDLIFEKKVPKKKFKQLQLTLQVKETGKQNIGVESDVEDIIMPSPNKLCEDQVDDEDLESSFAPGATSTQMPVNSEAVFKGKPQSPAKPETSTAANSNRNLDNSFDVILDKRKTTPSPNYKYKGKTVRGKARAQLQGWDCDECKKFYEIACKDQSPSKVKAKMNTCSRHRSKFKARPLTPPGFWDIDIPDTPE